MPFARQVRPRGVLPPPPTATFPRTAIASRADGESGRSRVLAPRPLDHHTVNARLKEGGLQTVLKAAVFEYRSTRTAVPPSMETESLP